MKAILLTLSVISSTSYVKAGDNCFPVGKQMFLDASPIPSWYNDYIYPYVFMFGDNGHNTWVKLRKYTEYGKSRYFSWTVPHGGYYGLIFSCHNCDMGTFEKCNSQTINIYCDNRNNCYTFNNKYSEGKIMGYWNNIDFLGGKCFPAGKELFLDTTNAPNWSNPYMYMFGLDGRDEWVKMTKYIGGGTQHFSGIVPNDGYCALVFTSQDGKICNWNNCNAQTININWDNESNCYVLDNKSIDGRILGNWSTVNLSKQQVVDGKYKVGIISVYSNDNYSKY